MEIPGYRAAEELVRTGPFVVYRARQLADGRMVLVKTPVRADARAAEIDALERELVLLGRLSLPGVPAPVGMVRSETSASLVIEDRGLEPLRKRLESGRLELPWFFRIAIQLCTILEGLHRQRVTCGSVSPEHMLVSPDASLVQLFDFSLASLWPRDGTAVSRIPGTATPYLSPEQTGRINRTIDHRTDFYSLGATLYELLTGAPPFASDDPLELIHAHIARTPAAPASLAPSIPEQLSRIVMRLLAKAAEDRYQSAAGIRRDL